MSGFDENWENPSRAQQCALQMANERPVHDLPPVVDVARMICLAGHSQWVERLKNWGAGENLPPSMLDDEDDVLKTWYAGAASLADLIGLGYDEELDMWWPVHKLVTGDRDELAEWHIRLSGFGLLVDQARSTDHVPREIDQVLSIVLGMDWRDRFDEANRMTEPQP